MAIQIGINGSDALEESPSVSPISQPETFHLCGINVRNADLNYMVYMIRYDSIFGRFQGRTICLRWRNPCKRTENPCIFRK